MGVWWLERDLLSARDLRTTEWATAAFRLRLRRIPSSVWRQPCVLRAPLQQIDSSDVFTTINDVWRGHALAAMQSIWCRCLGRMDDSDPWGQQRALSQRSSIATLLDELHDHVRTPATQLRSDLLTMCLARVDTTTASALATGPNTDTARFLLFFDGGSSGNPGPGGSGAFILGTTVLGLAYELVWSAAVHHPAPDTTNNTAEYAGLVEGLVAAARHRWLPLEVIGDSQRILSQMRDYLPPAQPAPPPRVRACPAAR